MINLDDIKNRNWGAYGTVQDIVDALVADCERLEKENEAIIQIIRQQRWHFSDVEWENLMNRIQAIAKCEEKKC